MRIEGELWRAVATLVRDSPQAILATADAGGMPHVTWMNVMVSGGLDEVVAITLPTTQKVANLRENPKAEWTFASRSQESFVYLSGSTEIVGGEEADRLYRTMPGKSAAFYRNAAGGGGDDPGDFAIIRTRVSRVVYCRPPGYHKVVVMDGVE